MQATAAYKARRPEPHRSYCQRLPSPQRGDLPVLFVVAPLPLRLEYSCCNVPPPTALLGTVELRARLSVALLILYTHTVVNASTRGTFLSGRKEYILLTSSEPHISTRAVVFLWL